jgi:rieske iron-sulfur protein
MTTKARKVDSEISRRKFVTGAIGVTGGIAGVSLLTLLGGLTAKKFISEEEKMVGVGDILVHADGDNKGKPIEVSSLKEDQYFLAYPADKEGKIRDKGTATRFNAVLVSKYAVAKLVEPLKKEATAEGIVVLTTVCTHAGCTLGARDKEFNLPCGCHGSKFNGITGAVVAQPAPLPLAQLPIKITDNKLVVAGNWLSPVLGAPKTEGASQEEKV